MKLPRDMPEEAKFAMAPMIDMVFLLLVFFMCASHLDSQKTRQMTLATASHALIPEERPDRWVVNIERDGVVYSGKDVITIEELKATVTARRREDPKLKVYLRADADSPHKNVKRVMNAMAEAGIDDFIFGVYTTNKE